LLGTPFETTVRHRKWHVSSGDDTAVYTLPPGLCGNADGDTRNDFITRDGRDVYRWSRRRRNWAFGNPWRVASIVRKVARADTDGMSITSSIDAEAIAAAGATPQRVEVAPLSGKEQ